MKNFLCVSLCLFQSVMLPMQQHLNPAVMNEIQRHQEFHEVAIDCEPQDRDKEDALVARLPDSDLSLQPERVLRVVPMDRSAKATVIIAGMACAACCLGSVMIIIMSVMQSLKLK